MSNSHTLTLAQLRKAGACFGGLKAFKAEFGQSVEVTVELAVSLTGKPGFDFGWAADRLLSSSAWQAYKAAIEPARQAYEAATEPAWQAYKAAEAEAFAIAYINDKGA